MPRQAEELLQQHRAEIEQVEAVEEILLDVSALLRPAQNTGCVGAAAGRRSAELTKVVHRLVPQRTYPPFVAFAVQMFGLVCGDTLALWRAELDGLWLRSQRLGEHRIEQAAAGGGCVGQAGL